MLPVNWTEYANKIYLLNLSSRPDRLTQSRTELRRYSIPFERFEATPNKERPREGLKATMKALFTHCVEQDYQRVLVLEDDIKFLVDPNFWLPRCIDQLQKTEWDLFYLGLNVSEGKGLIKRHSENLLLIGEGYSTHAVMYSNEAMRQVLEFPEHERPIDVLLAWNIQSQGRSFCSYPMIATQRDGWSDIEGQRLSYKSCLEQAFSKEAKKIMAHGA